MYKVKFYSNEDKFKNYDWPSKVIIEPKVGQYVEAVGGGSRMKINSITHAEMEHPSYTQSGLRSFGDKVVEKIPFLKIELVKGT